MAPPLYARILLPQLGDAQAAEDVLAETFARAIERLDGYQDRGGSIWSWLVTIARNRALDLHRARARDGRAAGQLRGAARAASLGERGDAGDAGPRPASGCVTRWRRRCRRINPRYRRALELRFFEERERAECAALLEVKLGTFDVLLLRALRAFRAEWLDSKGAEERPEESRHERRRTSCPRRPRRSPKRRRWPARWRRRARERSRGRGAPRTRWLPRRSCGARARRSRPRGPGAPGELRRRETRATPGSGGAAAQPAAGWGWLAPALFLPRRRPSC